MEAVLQCKGLRDSASIKCAAETLVANFGMQTFLLFKSKNSGSMLKWSTLLNDNLLVSYSVFHEYGKYY